MKKGFTLIELLAVIVILAILALIAIPIINNVILGAKKNAFRVSASYILDAADYYFFTHDEINNNDFIKLDIGKNDDVKIQFKGSRPDNGQVLRDSDGNVSLYMYSKDLKACVIKDYYNDDIILHENVTEDICKKVLEKPLILSDIVKIGDYVNYEAGIWNENKPYGDIISFGEFGGYQSGMSRNQGVACENNGSIVNEAYGWRVIDVDQSTGAVSLVHAGTPECYRNEWGRNTESVDILKNRNYSIYVDSKYAKSATIFTKEMAEKVYGSIIEAGAGFYDLEHDVLKSYSRYWFPTPHGDNNLMYVQPGGYVGSMGSYTYGIRPVVILKENLLITDGTGTINNGYKIETKFTAKSAIENEGLLTGYWENWNGVSNIELSKVPYSYDIIALAFGLTKDGSLKGTVDFSLDQYLSNHLDGYTGQDLKDDIRVLQMRGKKVVLSIGGATGNVIVDDEQSTDNFVNSVMNLINEYKFDGIDINLENGIYPTFLANALTRISNNIGPNFILTLAPQTVDFKVNGSGQVSGAYYDLISQIKEIVTIVNIQLYNSGDQYGLDGNIYYPGTVDFITSLTTILLENGLEQSQVGIGTNYNSTKTGYMEPEYIIDAYNSLKLGGTTLGGTYDIPNQYPNLGGFMIWSINGDHSIGNKFSDAYITVLK